LLVKPMVENAGKQLTDVGEAWKIMVRSKLSDREIPPLPPTNGTLPESFQIPKFSDGFIRLTETRPNLKYPTRHSTLHGYGMRSNYNIHRMLQVYYFGLLSLVLTLLCTYAIRLLNLDICTPHLLFIIIIDIYTLCLISSCH